MAGVCLEGRADLGGSEEEDEEGSCASCLRRGTAAVVVAEAAFRPRLAGAPVSTAPSFPRDAAAVPAGVGLSPASPSSSDDAPATAIATAAPIPPVVVTPSLVLEREGDALVVTP